MIETINSPEDLRKLSLEQLPVLAQEIRKFMLEHVSHCGGHLASSLGCVELAIALHYCFNTPEDKIVWDVGHQAYAHKILTGRREGFKNLRQFKGISGFPRINESKYDAASVGHASTSISIALGLAIARDIKKEKHSVISVIGDGSFSGGLAFEGLNNLGTLATDLIIILNDNKMSISPNIGALSRYLTRIITDKRYQKIKDEVWELTGKLSTLGTRIRSLVKSIDDTIKHFVIPGKLFEDMGIRYLGPVDGHNIKELVDMFKYLKNQSKGPVLVHTITTKGKGYSYAENDAIKYHGISQFSIDTGKVISGTLRKPSFSEVFGATIVEIAEKNKDIVAITAAMPDGTGLSLFKEKFPQRFFDVGIAEEHAVTFAAGLALKGLKPVVAIYSTFLQRAFDQIIHDVALDKLNVVFCIDRAGIVGEDGPTHHGTFDLSYLRCIPNAVIMAPKDGTELKNMIYSAIDYNNGPIFIRYGRGTIPEENLQNQITPIQFFEPEIIKQGKKCAVLSIGDIFKNVQDAIRIIYSNHKLDLTFVNCRFVKPLSKVFYLKIFSQHTHIVTLENNSLIGGFGSAISELATEFNTSKGVNPKILSLGYPDNFIEHGKIEILQKQLQLDPESIANKITEFLNI